MARIDVFLESGFTLDVPDTFTEEQRLDAARARLAFLAVDLSWTPHFSITEAEDLDDVR